MLKNNENKKVSKKSKKYFLLIISLCFVFILFFILYKSFFYTSAEEQLAAIEASRAIPDSENAAVYYNMFLTDSNNIAVLDELFNNYAQASHYLPWKSDSNPEGSAILQEHHLFFENFAEISKIPKARISFDSSDFLNKRIYVYFRKIAFILSWAGANDIGDGRIDEAINKFTSQVMIGCHLNQQPVKINKQVGIAIESVGLKNIRDLTMYEDITKEQLKLLDTIVSETQNYIGQDKELEDKIEKLLNAAQSKNKTFITRIKMWFTNLQTRNTEEEDWQKHLLRRISTQRASRIMIALKLYQKQNSRWPQTLNEIESSLPKENFTDAMNNSDFVYKLLDDSFIFYSKGLNNIDDNNKTGSNDIIFWSPPKSQSLEKNTPDPNEEIKE